MWRYLKGKAEASLPAERWRELEFLDPAWEQTAMPLFYGESFLGTTLNDMRGSYSSLYLRKVFSVPDPKNIGSLTLTALSDDGFVAWLNGKEIARYNVPEGELRHNSTALVPLLDPLSPVDHEVPRPWELLVPGENVLAIQALNSSISDSSDFFIDAGLAAIADTTRPIVLETIPPQNATVDELFQVEIVFSETVVGVAKEDLLIQGMPATDVKRVTPQQYVFSFDQPPAGDVEFRWRDGHAISDDLGRANAFAGGSWRVKLDPTSSRKNLLITEFMADNDKTLLDDDRDKSDWIEIYNSGTTPINLQGWALTDDARDLGKWRFPDYMLEGEAFLVVFASLKNKLNPTKRLHTNFKLDEKGEYLALVAPNGEVISHFASAFPQQTRDVSYGRATAAPDQVGYLTKPTPGARNAESGSGFASPVGFSRSSTAFVQPFTLLLSCPDSDAVIRYTVDGSFPGETNLNLRTYASPFVISNTVQVRARAFVKGKLPGQPSSETFLALTNNPAHLGTFTSTLPIVVMTTLKETRISDIRNTAVHFSVFEPIDGRSSLRGKASLNSRGGAKTRGSSTGGQPQSNFAIEWWDEFDQDKDLPVLGMPEDSEWVLYAPNVFDPPLIHNPFTMEISRQMEFSAPRTRFVEVYLNKGGPIRSNDWFGVYVLMEKPGLSKHRIDAPKAEPEDVEFPEVTGSYLFKTDRLDPSDTGFTAGGALNAYVEPKEREMKTAQRAPQLAYLKKYFADLDNALKASNTNWRDPILGYRAYIELTNWVDFHMLETLSGQVDAIRLSTYFYKRRDGKLEYGPRWDYDRAWESKGDDRDNIPRIWDTGGGLFAMPWWNRVLADRDAWQLWIDRWQMFRKTALSQSNLFSVIDAMTNQVVPSQPREVRRWPETAPRGSYSNEIRIMKNWISNRLDWIDLQLAQPPLLSSPSATVTPGFLLTIHPPTNVSHPTNIAIYYTLDGSDPRPPGGTNTPVAFLYNGPIIINTNTRVVARAHDSKRIQRGPPSSSSWSSSASGTYVVKPPQLAVTELMYDPEPPPVGSVFTPGDFEFLEIKNVSSEPVSLDGYHFTAGIAYRFTTASGVSKLAPGERLILVGNQTAFASRYPSLTQVAGQFAGSLNDQGERIAMAGPAGEPIFDFDFTAHREPMSNGLGFSIVLADESTPPSLIGQPGRWRQSAAAGGSPFLNDPRPAIVPRVLINELMTHPLPGKDDWIELHNPEATIAEVSGWWLSDDRNTPKKVRLPLGSTINPGGFLVVDARVFDAPSKNGFGLKNEGDELWLFSADTEGNLTGWIHGFRFAASDPGVSFGRMVTSTGAEHFVAQSSPTPATPNGKPRVGPVVISEIMFHPPAFGSQNNQRDEFIELRNITDNPVPLFDPSAPLNTWRLRGGVEFDFPPNVILPPQGLVTLVGFRVDDNPFTESAFRARYSLDGNALLFGPWKGTLGNSGDPIQLLKPLSNMAREPDQSPVVLIDQIVYESKPPWPDGAGGTDQSIGRINAPGYGDDPSNWRTVPPSPGGADDDADGLPDLWEKLHALDPNEGVGSNGAKGDPDGDGFTNRQEYINRTLPKFASSALALRAYFAGEGLVYFTFAWPPGRIVQFQTRSNLSHGSWQTIRTLADPPDGLIQTSEFASEAEAYYRLVIQ